MITSYLARQDEGGERGERRDGWQLVRVLQWWSPLSYQLFPLQAAWGWETCNDKVPVYHHHHSHTQPQSIVSQDNYIYINHMIHSRPTPVHSCHISFYFLPGPLSNWQVGSYRLGPVQASDWIITISGKKVISNQLATTLWISYGSMHEK